MKIELSFHAVNLKNVAGAFKGVSDPFAVITKVATTPGSQPQVLGRTETICNTLNPQWVATFKCDYELGEICKIAVNIFDEQKKGDNIAMGCTVFEIGELLGARGNTKAKKLAKGGTIFAMARKSTGSGILRFRLKGSNLKNVEGFMRKSDPFFELSRRIDVAGGSSYDNVYRSKPVKDNLSPEWEADAIELGTLCGGDLDLPIKLSVYDFEDDGKHVAMGSLETSVKALQQAAAAGTRLHLQQKSDVVGSIMVEQAGVEGVQDVTQMMAATSISATTNSVNDRSRTPDDTGTFNFVDYVSGGCSLNVVVAIDFTGSNGDPRQPGTLHHISPNTKNDYEKAITSIVGILEKYDSDKRFPVVGFGAKYNGVVKHCFQCGASNEVVGVDGVLDAYNQVFQSGLIMSAPTVFNEVIEMAAEHARKSLDESRRRGRQAYTVLLIITDGAVSDPVATAACLDGVSNAPLSVVIVGVGSADFSSMRFLDDRSRSKRDIVQFVEFNRHCTSSVDLSSATLKEVPAQLEGFFRLQGLHPLPPVLAHETEVAVEQEAEIDLRLHVSEDDIVVTSGGHDYISGF